MERTWQWPLHMSTSLIKLYFCPWHYSKAHTGATSCKLSKGIGQDDLQSPFQPQLFCDSVKSRANAGFHKEHLKYNLTRLHILILLVMWPTMLTRTYFSFLEHNLEELTIHVTVSLQKSCSFFIPSLLSLGKQNLVLAEEKQGHASISCGIVCSVG